VHFALEGCTGWRYVTEELAARGIIPHLAEPADTAALRGRKRHAKTDKTDSGTCGCTSWPGICRSAGSRRPKQSHLKSQRGQSSSDSHRCWTIVWPGQVPRRPC
jgi:hypothetical protein